MIRILAISAVILAISGCSCPSASAWKGAWKDIRGPYLIYVEKDAELTDTDKEIRKQHVFLMDRILEKVK